MRCLTLGTALRERGASVSFACREHEGHLCDLIEERGFAVTRLPRPAANGRPDGPPPHAAWLGATWHEDAAQVHALIAGKRIDWLVVDHYALDERWEREVGSHAWRIMAIDDLADRNHDCEILLDQNLWPEQDRRYVGKVPKECRLLLGPTYALLRPEFSEARKRARARGRGLNCNRILVSYGGPDPDGNTLAALKAVAAERRERPELVVDIVIGSGNPRIAEITRRCAELPNALLHVDSIEMAALMERADLGIGAAGTTIWERACLGMPSIVTPIAEHQLALAEHIASIGAALLVPTLSATGEELLHAMQLCFRDARLRRDLSDVGFGLVDGLGVERVANAMMEAVFKDLLRRTGR